MSETAGASAEGEVLSPSGTPENHASLQLGTTALARLGVMGAGFVLSAVMTVVLTRLHGASGYAIAALLVSLLQAFPFADLGLGAAVVNATADVRAGRLSREHYHDVLRATVRLLWGVALALVLVALLLTLTGAWRTVLGSLASEPASAGAFFVTLAALAVSIPLGIGTRVLQGDGRTRLWTLLSFGGTAMQALGLLGCVLFDAPAAWYVVGPALGLLANAITATAVGGRLLGLDATIWLPGRGLGAFPPSYRPRETAVPTVITMVGIALSLQIDRVLLSQVSGPTSVAEYSYIGQFAVAIASVVTLMSLNLWPRYRASVLARSVEPRRVWRDMRLFLLIGLGFALVMIVMTSALAPVLVGSAFEVHLGSVLAAAAYIVAWSLVRPGTMLLSDPRGMWAQVIWIVPQTICNVVLTLLLGHWIGAMGAFLASAISIAALQAVPLTLTALRLYSRRLA
jgi:O-antigen/teichoic acid export membrane protein